MEGFIFGLIGAGGVVAIYGLSKSPAALAKLKAWWGKGKADLATLRGDVAAAHAKATDVEAKVSGLAGEAKTYADGILTQAKADVAQVDGAVKAVTDRLNRAGIAQ
jgi:hypothetical protein